MKKNEIRQNKLPLATRRYDSFLNRIMSEFARSSNDVDYKTQKRMLGLSIGIIESFTEIYGKHELKEASTPVSRMLAELSAIEN